MNAEVKKMKIIDWIAGLKDLKAIEQLWTVKLKLEAHKERTETKIFGTGKHLIADIADDFNEPLDSFKEYQK